MNNIVPFNFENTELRVVTDDRGIAWFNANDVCAALELANPRAAIAKHADPDDVAKRDIIDSLGRSQLASFVNESGLYALIMGSTKDAAKRFKRWVTDEVLPSIRKTGSYTAQISTASPLRITVEAAKACIYPVTHPKLFFKLTRFCFCYQRCFPMSTCNTEHCGMGTNWIVVNL